MMTTYNRATSQMCQSRLSNSCTGAFLRVSACLVIGLFVGCLTHSVRADSQPNILVILSDDMGYSDIGCYGGEIETPTLDQLARDGIRFTQFYNTGRCCPTRASLLSGLYPHQAGIGHMMDDRGFPGYRGEFGDNCYTIAEALRPAGYQNYMAGKWHITHGLSPKKDGDKKNWPIQRGFDRFYGTIHGAGSFFDPNTLVRDNGFISPYADPSYKPDSYYYTDAIADHAVRFIHEHDTTKPFFMYVAFTAAHWPMHAKENDLAKYKGRYKEGYSTVRANRYQKMLQHGLVTEDSTTLWPLEEQWGEHGEYWPWDERNMEVYAAMVDSMDQGIGKIVQALEATNQFNNTLVCYMQDNGGCAEGMGRRNVGEPRASTPSFPPMKPDTLQMDMIPKQTRDGYPVRQGKGVLAGPADTYIGYGQAWATVSNTPFRKYKHWVHEGGIATPLIVHWPRGIVDPGRMEKTPSHLIDIMATAVDIADADYPKNKTPLEGMSLQPLFQKKFLPKRELYWEHEGNRAIRDGNWKLVAGFNQPWELYDISSDRSEQHDLSNKQIDRAKNMAEAWDAYAARAQVISWENFRSRKNSKAKKK